MNVFPFLDIQTDHSILFEVVVLLFTVPMMIMPVNHSTHTIELPSSYG